MGDNGWVMVTAKEKKPKNMNRRVKRGLTPTSTLNKPAFHYKAQTDTYCTALHWHHFTNYEFKWSAKCSLDSGKADQTS